MRQVRRSIELNEELNDESLGVEGGDRQSAAQLLGRVLEAAEVGGSLGRNHVDLRVCLPNLSSWKPHHQGEVAHDAEEQLWVWWLRNRHDDCEQGNLQR